MQSSSTMIRWKGNLGRISESEKVTLLFDYLTCSEIKFRWVGTAWVLSLGTDNKWKPDERSCLGLGAKDSMENRYEKIYIIVPSLWQATYSEFRELCCTSGDTHLQKTINNTKMCFGYMSLEYVLIIF